ncbi:unnamed protein product [Pleuronectes platessa]|uniref:Uncharacterized protein n=1 Tax=Pleuronectes platessa TaxID=8262 RepID=A0A9N7UP94_PLEPL|nr:unnamed protein product [Pleuronectes platessa]
MVVKDLLLIPRSAHPIPSPQRGELCRYCHLVDGVLMDVKGEEQQGSSSSEGQDLRRLQRKGSTRMVHSRLKPGQDNPGSCSSGTERQSDFLNRLSVRGDAEKKGSIRKTLIYSHADQPACPPTQSKHTQKTPRPLCGGSWWARTCVAFGCRVPPARRPPPWPPPAVSLLTDPLHPPPVTPHSAPPKYQEEVFL